MCSRTSRVVLKSTKVFDLGGRGTVEKGIAEGEAAGIAVCRSLAEGVTPREINVKGLQAEIIATGGNLGQSMRTIEGITDAIINYDDKHKNVCYNLYRSVTIQNMANEFTGK